MQASRSRIQIQTPDHPAYEGVDCTFPEDIELGGHYGSTLFEHQRFRDQLAGAANDGATCAEGLWAIITAWMAQASMQQGDVVDVKDISALSGVLAQRHPTIRCPPLIKGDD